MNLLKIGNIIAGKTLVFVFLAFALISSSNAVVSNGSFNCTEENEYDGGGGGSSSGYVTPKSYYLLESIGTFEKTVVVGHVLSFKVNNETHYITIISLVSDSITIEINSTPIRTMLPVGETRFFDLDGDGWYDVSIHLKEITAGKAYITIETFAKKLVETATSAVEQPTITSEYKPSASAGTSQVVDESANVSAETVLLQNGVISVIVIGALAIGAYITFFLHKGRKCRR